MASDKYSFTNRELSWLSFNERVLQEAHDPGVPLFERLGFLSIYSSNLDEFFRVRVASIRSLLRLKKKSIEELDFNPEKLLRKIHRVVAAQQEEFGRIHRSQIMKELGTLGIYMLDDRALDPQQRDYVAWYFSEHVQQYLTPYVLDSQKEAPFLADRRLYLVSELTDPEGRIQFGLVAIPSDKLPRFVWVPGDERHKYVMYLDDVVRHNLATLFPGFTPDGAFAIKLTRDADLYLEDEFEGNLIEKIRKSLQQREKGLPSRFLYDQDMPEAMLDCLRKTLNLEDEDLVEGGRYHNLSDLRGFPRFGLTELSYEPLPPLPSRTLGSNSYFLEIARRDHLLHYPYQRFDYVINFLKEAAADPAVEAIWISLYRVASDSAIVEALIDASKAGKQVTAFVEVKARFDEEPNLRWADRMKESGIRVLYSMPGIKVHAKIALVARREGDTQRFYAYLSTGNFNEKTARIYADNGLFTSHPHLTTEVYELFRYLSGEITEPKFHYLLVAPFTMRETFYELIDREIEHARAGREARMVLKMNSLEDQRIITRLYKASNAGVQIDIIVRGICRLVPGVRGQSENIVVRSIIDRFLEHSRIFYFKNNGDEEFFLASADWMKRNLSHRVEVGFPVYDPEAREELRAVINLQLADDTKARLIDPDLRNAYYRTPESPSARAQIDTYCMLKLQAQPQAQTGVQAA